MSPPAPDFLGWLHETGFIVKDQHLWRAALTHGSLGEDADYERLEFLGDRVLGLCVANILFESMDAPEGQLSLRLNALVSRQSCAHVARSIGVAEHVRMGSQARNDGGADSDNILGDVMEALLGANHLEAGFAPTRDLVARLWRELLLGERGRAKHPKSALQEWTAAKRRAPPEYEVIERFGPDHSAKFAVRVAVKNVGEAQAVASSKQEAETAAAKAFMERYGG